MKVTLLDIGIMWDRNGIYFYRLSEKLIVADSKPNEDADAFGKRALSIVENYDQNSKTSRLQGAS